jgi:hypothetical protein
MLARMTVAMINLDTKGHVRVTHKVTEIGMGRAPRFLRVVVAFDRTFLLTEKRINLVLT